MAFKDYKDLDLKPEKVDKKELKELRKKYGVKIAPKSVKKVNAEK